MRYFADAWFFIALFNRRDNHHSRVRRLIRTIEPDELVTHDYVSSEVLAYVAGEGAESRGRAVNAIRQTMRESDVLIADRPLFLRALDRYAARPHKKYSLVDCMSMVVMEERGIRHVLTNDHHFTQAGFVVVSG